jgi:hypothetical protein
VVRHLGVTATEPEKATSNQLVHGLHAALPRIQNNPRGDSLCRVAQGPGLDFPGNPEGR